MSMDIIFAIIITAITCSFLLFMFLTWLIGGVIESRKTHRPTSCCLGYHKPIGKIGFDGCSATCTCKKCGDKLLQDSQGNWFSAE